MTSVSGLRRGGAVLVVKSMGTWGKCECSGNIVYYSDCGVRCQKCHKLYGTWVENLKRAKEEERIRKQEIVKKIAISRFNKEMAV